MAKPSKDEFLMQAIETVVDMAAQSTERIADLLPADLFASAMQPQQQQEEAPPPEMQGGANQSIKDWLNSPEELQSQPEEQTTEFEEVGF